MALTLGDTPSNADPDTRKDGAAAEPAAGLSLSHLTLGDSDSPLDTLPVQDSPDVPPPPQGVSLSLGDPLEIVPETPDLPAPPPAPSSLTLSEAVEEERPKPEPEAEPEPLPDPEPEATPEPVAVAEEPAALPAQPDPDHFSVTGTRAAAEAPPPVDQTPVDLPVPTPPQDWAFSVAGFKPPPPSSGAARRTAAPVAVPVTAAPVRAAQAQAPKSPAPPSPTPAKPAAAPKAPAPAPPKAAEPPKAPQAQAPAAPPADGGGKKPVRLGDQLVEMGLISKDQLHVALLEKRNSPKMMGELLVDLGFITEQALAAVLAESAGMERFTMGKTMVDTVLLKKLPKEIALRYRVFPVSGDEETVRVAMADVYDVLALDQLQRYFGVSVTIQPMVCGESDIQKAIDQYYGYELSIDGILRELDRAGTAADDVALLDQEGAYTHPIVRLVDAIMLDAVKQKASDIHYEPDGNFLRVRYRIDGEMTQIRTIHKRHWAAFSHRLKLMSGMNIADKLNPQDGRFSMSMGAQRIDYRVSSLPTVHGENLVLRILDKSAATVPLEALGYTPENFELLTRMVKRPEGIIIVTGPTGSGKTTTLYSVLNYINCLELNIMTLEDPVEYELPLIRQSQVREGTNMTFSEGIRTLLRQDPDIILIGEVRDADTATMALRAAMTGHQVYTTLHTNDAAGAIPRLIDMGMRPSLMAGNIIGIVAQRLGRKLCNDCKEAHVATEQECRILAVDPASPPTIYEPVGCPECRGTGHKGRIAVSEILPFNETIDELIIQNQPVSKVKAEALKIGFVPMVEDAARKVLEGTISIPAMMRIVDVTDRL